MGGALYCFGLGGFGFCLFVFSLGWFLFVFFLGGRGVCLDFFSSDLLVRLSVLINKK